MEILFSFNWISSVEYDAFRFPNLRRLLLNDNRISRVDPQSFVEMTKLLYLSLEGNQARVVCFIPNLSK